MAIIFEEVNLDSVQVANALRFFGKEENHQLNQTQINKLLYIVLKGFFARMNQNTDI